MTEPDRPATVPDRAATEADRPAAEPGLSIGVRRVAELDAGPLPESDPALIAQIHAEVRDGGPLTFARFMEIALYDPESGYYASGRGGPGRERDFLTAPEGHPIFGWAIARQLEEVWERLGRPDPFLVREHGAGSGALGLGVLDGLRRSGSGLASTVRYQAAEASRGSLDRLRAAFAAAGLDDRLEPLDERAAPGAILANELLDAFPVHLVEGGPDGTPRERFVALDAEGELALVAGVPSTPALAARLADEGVSLEPGQRAEICLGINEWLRAAVALLDRGLVLLIDYGYPASDLYAPARGSTLRAYSRHHVHDDPLVAIGRQDLTAHIDLTAVERAAATTGLELLGRTTQAEFLAGLGIGELLVGLQSDPSSTLESYLGARAAVMRLLDPRATGGFSVLLFGRELAAEPPLRGLVYTGPKRD